jgi:ribosomal-protein-alanine N-acetyltransferase
MEDLGKVISINLITLPEHYSDYFFEDLLKSSPESFIVAEKDDEIVGYIMCRIEYGFSNFKRFNLSRKGHIVSLAVLENHRGNRLGKSLIISAVNALRATNDEAVAIYKQLGFKITSVISGYYRDNEKANLMGIQLT